MESAHLERLSFFEVERTPPEEKRRREKLAEEVAKDTPEILLLTPFASSPKLEFDRIKLGRSGVRKLLIRNPGEKPLDVVLDRLPKEEKGFSIDYVAFTLGGREETFLLVGWTPTKPGGVRESVIVKFGGKFSAQLILIGSCVDPEAGKRRPLSLSTSTTRPLGPRNSNVRSGGRGRPSVPASKLNAPPAQPKVSIPPNPVTRQGGSPPKRHIGGISPPKESFNNHFQQPRNPPSSKFVCGTTFNPGEFSKTENFLSQSPRRETYVQERPMPSTEDIVESTPIPDRREEQRRSEIGDTRLSNIMPPPASEVKRQTFVPSKLALPPVTDNSNDEDEAEADLRRQTFVKLPQPGKDAAPVNKTTYVKLPSAPISQEANLEPKTSVSEESDAPINLSIAPLNLSSKPKALSDLLDQLNDVESEPLDLSFPSSDSKEPVIVTPLKERKDITLNITESKFTPNRYCPRVSDISLPDTDPPPPHVVKTPIAKNPLRVQDIKEAKTPLRDPRLVQLMGNMNISGCADLDLSLGSQFGDCSLAVNLASPARDRNGDFDEEELGEIEDNKENYDEHELEMIARARGTSALGDRSNSYVEKSPRLSTGTIVKTAPSVDEEMLPTVIETEVVHSEEQLIKKHSDQRSQVVYEEIITNEVVEEVIELEFEIVDGKKTLVGEKNLGKTVTKEIETICKTPTFKRRQAQCDISKIIEQQLTDSVQNQMIPRSVDLTDAQITVFKATVHEPININKMEGDAEVTGTGIEPCYPDPPQSFDRTREKEQQPVTIQIPPGHTTERLPGLRGSPRISNQIARQPDNFLCVTVNETSFMPPSPDDPRRCSTGVKNKDHAPAKTPSPNAFVRKSLFDGQEAQTELTSPPGAESVRLNSQGFVLPVITSEHTEDKRLSTDTYIAGGDSPRLSTIAEEESVSRTATQTAQEDTIKTTGESVDADNDANDAVDTTTERKALKPKRSMITYNSRKIEAIAKPRRSLNLVKKTQPVDVQESGGMMFIALSPPSNSEKRKPEVGESKTDKVKRTKTVIPPSLASTNRPTVRAVKNPILLRSGAVNPGLKAKDVTRGASVKPSPASLPPRQPVSRVINPTKRLALNKPSKSIVHHPNPFASRNQYYDEKWVEKQERGFSKWLNFFLTPQLLDDGESPIPRSIDIANLWSQCSRDVKEPRAPTKEQMSLRQYTVKTEMNRLRKRACRIWQSRDVATVIRKVELEIEKMRLVVRKDRNITKDVGMKMSLLKLILSYNPLWLRLGLETVYGEILSLSSNSDLLGLSRFLITRWLSNPDVLSEYAHPSVPHSYREGCQDALNKFALKKFLELVYFLDIVKEAKLIRHNPCLFCPDSQFKSSRELLLTFAKDYLAGEGDITKHLAYMNYVVSHKQSKLDEFDFAVTNIKTDLRCGVRLAKVAELLAGGSDVMNTLRVPSVSRLQKVHNVDLALTALRRGGAEIRKEIIAKDLVDGHREKTLEILWAIIFGYQLATILDLDNIREEINHLKRSLAAKARLGDADARAGSLWLQELACRSPMQSALAGERLELLLDWVRLVLVHHGVRIENWTTSWCDGRALCLLVHHYQPDILDRADIRDVTTLTHQADNQNLDDSADFCYGTKNLDSKSYEMFVENEKSNFRLLLQRVSLLGGVPVLITPGDMSNTIPDEKVTATFIGYLAVRLLDLSREIKAARTIQLAWRKYYAVRKEEQLKVQTAAALILQRHIRVLLHKKKIERYTLASITIQKHARALIARRELRKLKCLAEARKFASSVCLIQAWWRTRLIRMAFLKKRSAVITLQSHFRGTMVRRQVQRHHSAAEKIQRQWRMVLRRREQKMLTERRFLAAVIVQTHVRSWIQKRRYQRIREAVIVIQATVRRNKEVKEYRVKRASATTIQQWWRGCLEGQRVRNKIEIQRHATVKIQSVIRMVLLRRRFLRTKSTIISLQAAYRGILCRRAKNQRIEALKKIQSWWRNVLMSRKIKEGFLETRKKIILVQSVVRMRAVRKSYLDTQKSVLTIQKMSRMVKQRKKYLETKSAVLIIQDYWRRYIICKQTRETFLNQKIAATKIASWLKMEMIRKEFTEKKRCAITIQKNVKMYLARSSFLKMKSSAVTLQQHWRSRLIKQTVREEFLLKKFSVTKISSWWKMVNARRQYNNLINKVILLQSLVRMVIQKQEYIRVKEAAITLQKQFRAQCIMRRDRNSFQEMKASVTKISSWYKKIIDRRNYLDQRAKIVKIQSNVRMMLIRQNYLKLIQAVRTIQTRYRAQKSMMIEKETFALKKNAATTITSWWKMKQAHSEYLNNRNIIIKMQANVRSIQQRKKYVLMKKSVSCLQCRFRAQRLMKRDRSDFLNRKFAAVKIQSAWRRRKDLQSYQTKRRAVILIQANVRRAQAMRRYTEDRASILKIQSLMRMRATRNQYFRTKVAATRIQAWWRMQHCRMSYKAVLDIVIMIQSNIRRYTAVKKYRSLKQAVLTLESHYSRYMAAKRQRVDFLRLRQSAIVLQTAWRRRMEMRKFSEERQKVITAQSAVRGFLARKKLFKLKKDQSEYDSAVLIQSHVRKILERKKYFKIKASVLRIQTVWRARLTGRKERTRYLKLRHSAVVLQSSWRGKLQRLQYQKTREKLICCQAAIRGFIARHIYQRQIRSALIIQKEIRRYLQAVAERRNFLEMRKSAVLIQSQWRGFIHRKSYEDQRSKILICQAAARRMFAMKQLQTLKIMKLKNDSAILIQKNVRCFLKKKDFLRRKIAAKTLQTHWRAKKQGELERNEFLKLKEVSIRMQSVFRGVKSRKNYQQQRNSVILCQAFVKRFLMRRRFLTMKKAAVKIQKGWRGYQQRLTDRRQFLLIKNSALKIQSWWRQVEQRRKYTSLKNSTVTIQKHVRALMARKEMRQMRLTFLQEKSSVKIQSAVRSWLVRQRLKCLRNSVRKIESFYEAFVAGREQRNIYLQQKRSALLIQSYCRKNETRRKFLLAKSSVVKILSWWKMILQRRSYLKQKSAAITLQTHFRAHTLGRKFRQDHLLKRQSVVIIQSFWRTVQAKRDFQKKKNAAVIIQKFTRGLISRRYAKRKRDALVCLQRAAIMMKSRKMFLQTRTMMTRLQAQCRGALSRRHFLQLKHDQEYREQLRLEQERLEEERQNLASSKITRHIKMIVDRKRFIKVKRSAVVIQKFWRGHWHRKVVMERISEMAATYRAVKEVKQRLEEATAAAKPEDCLAARTSSAIDYIFSIRDVAQLIRAVKTLDLSTRLSLECCVKMTEVFPSGSPVTQLASLMARCNRSEPHKEVVSTTLDILINIGRVSVTRDHLASVPNLLSDIFQTMLVYRDSSAEIFCKCCALLQLLSASSTMLNQLTTTQSKKKLVDYLTIVSKKKRLKEESQKRKSVGVLPPVSSSARKPLRPTNMNTTVTVRPAPTPAKPGLNTTVTLKSASKPRKPSLELASCPPWSQDTRPRHHEDPVTAVTSLNATLGIM